MCSFAKNEKMCPLIQKEKKCSSATKKRRRFGPPPKRRRCVPLQQGEKTRSSPKRKRCVHLQNTGQEVFICTKAEDVSTCKKKEKMCSSVKRSRCVPLQTKKGKMCSSSNFRLLQSFGTVKTSQDSCLNSSMTHQCHGTQAISKRHRLVVIELHTTALGPRTQTQPMFNGASTPLYNHEPRYLDHGLMLECTGQTGATALGPRTHAETHGPRHLGHSTMSSIFAVWRTALTYNPQMPRHSGHKQIEPAWY